jgi:hypothetical protein
MSGVFETAAGAFAVVGVVDVVVRTGREISGFLSEVKDAPSNMERLLNSINDTLQLSQASKACLRSLDNRNASLPKSEAILSLGSAIKTLNRELQSLKSLMAKFKGTKTWSRVKYVLSDAKIHKAIGHLESNKLLLSGALTLACRYVWDTCRISIATRYEEVLTECTEANCLHVEMPRPSLSYNSVSSKLASA